MSGKFTRQGMIEELAMEVEAAADHAMEYPVPQEVKEKLEKIERASLTIISLNNGLRTPKDRPNRRLAAILGIMALLLSTPAFGATASWYNAESCRREGTSGVWTANQERFHENAFTCAMRRRDFGKMYRVTNLDNGKSVVVRHNDFGPAKKLHDKGRIIDLSKGAFAQIADLKKGVVRVKVEAL